MFLLFSNEAGASKKAYLIIGARVVPIDARQPDRIEICEGVKCEHFSAVGPIWEVDPGIYEFKQIIFGLRDFVKFGSYFPDITLEAEHVYLFGRIIVDRDRFGPLRSGIKIDFDEELLRDACEVNPTIFELYPVINIHDGNKVQFDCN